MTVFERIKKLANNQGKGVSKVATDLGFSENLFYRWKTSEPKARDLQKVADYFDVSVDYLLGRTDNMATSSLNDENFDSSQNKTIAKQIMMRSDVDTISTEDAEEIEKELERFLDWRLEEIKRERSEKD